MTISELAQFATLCVVQLRRSGIRKYSGIVQGMCFGVVDEVG